MRIRFITISALLIALMILPCVSFGQRGRQGNAPSPTANLPFEPHDLNGYWERPTENRGMSSAPGVDVPPMTSEGQKLFDASKPGYGPRAVPPALGNDPVGECNPDGVPRVLFFHRPAEFIVLPDRFIQFFDWHRVYREIWMDGRELPKDPDMKRWFGYSVGHWEGNTLVVETNGFDDRTWVDVYGYPHTDEMRVQERYTRTDHDTITLQIIVNDTKIYTRPWVSETKTWKPVAKEALTRDGWHGLLEEACAPVDEVDTFNSRVRDPAAGLEKK